MLKYKQETIQVCSFVNQSAVQIVGRSALTSIQTGKITNYLCVY